jgi:hypothetical protein
MKTKFKCEVVGHSRDSIEIEIKFGDAKNQDFPYVVIRANHYNHTAGVIADKDLERFAVNILKALGSKKLKQ